MNKQLLATTLTTVVFLSAATAASASEPNFGSCLNPQWSVDQVNNSSNAQHGVINIGTFAGIDTIYKSGANVLQCLCTPEGKGYQTNWMNVKDLSETDIKVYQNQGWIYLTTGASYGLEDSAYLAKNSEYSCKECTPTPTPESKVAGDSATNTGTAITTLAKTGNMAVIAGFFIAGAVFLALGFLFKKFSK
ncbi:MAG: hypothetical protein AAB553_04845 [Patescibacteria group bacterium]